MKRSWFPILIVVLLLGLLGVLASLQYSWLGKISDDERERLQKRLEIDSQRFAEDFNREIQSAYFSLQLESKVWREQNYAAFFERYDAWRKAAKFPTLVKEIYFVRSEELRRFDAAGKTFAAADWTDELKTKKAELAANNFNTIDETNLLLTMPVYESELTRSPVTINGRITFTVPPSEIEKSVATRAESSPYPVLLPAKFGYLIIKLDAETIKNQIFPELANKYFSDDAAAGFRLTVINQKDAAAVVFASQPSNEFAAQIADASVPLFSLSPENLAGMVSRELRATIENELQSSPRVIFNQTSNEIRVSGTGTKASNVEKVIVPQSERSQLNVYRLERSGNRSPLILESSAGTGKWLLNVQHADGSLENYITNTRRKNLALSFGILSLLAVSVVLIFVSAQRAKRLAQRQLDFVSAVSHEFRTPLAVIRSAGENLTDGIVQNENQVSQYGSLIKREGVKLSAMVEQILEFAGARSGKRKYDLRETDVSKIIENALAECEPLITEKGFAVEKEIAENLPPVTIDEKAFSQAIQNLIVNSVKYSNGNRWLKISAKNGDGKIKITVEDRGIGIAPKDLKHVFEPFYRSKTVVDEQIHGNGLGLSLVKQTVEAHGGRVTVESQIEKGSRFTIHLPLNIKHLSAARMRAADNS